jgi:hypothetical protein
MFMQSGHDFFGDLVDAGIVEDRREVPLELAEETWHRIGPEVIAHLDELHRGFHPVERPIWAEEVFGPPMEARRRTVGRRR